MTHNMQWDILRNRAVLTVLTVMGAGRAMTLAFVGRAGGTGEGDPPIGWLMPLIGDAVVGVSALLVLGLIWKRGGLAAWTGAVVWNAVAIWDALSAFVVHRTVPWPSFFMIEMLGDSMFFIASAMHAVAIVVLCLPATRRGFGLPSETTAPADVSPSGVASAAPSLTTKLGN